MSDLWGATKDQGRIVGTSAQIKIASSQNDYSIESPGNYYFPERYSLSGLEAGEITGPAVRS